MRTPRRATKTELLKIAGCTWNTLGKHLRQSGAPTPDAAGMYDVAAVLSCILNHRQHDLSASGCGDVALARARKLHLHCELLQAKLDELHGTTISLSEAVQQTTTAFSELKSNVIAAVDRMPPAVQRVVREPLYDAFRQTARRLQGMGLADLAAIREAKGAKPCASK